MKIHMIYFVIVIITTESAYGKCPAKLLKIFEWDPEKIKFVTENEKLPEILKASGRYIPKNNIITGIATQPERKRMFVAMPRWKPGVFSTLNTVPLATGNLSESLHPYPSWEANDIAGNCKSPFKIISVLRVYLDPCNRLWVIDTGCDNYLSKNRKQIDKPKLLIFDAKTDNVIRIHHFDSSVVKADTASLGKIVVDVTVNTCDDAFAYITDVVNPGLIVYNYKKNKAFRIESNYLKMEPLKSTYFVDGKKIFSQANVDGICLSPLFKDGFRNLYVSIQTSNKQFVTTTKWLHDQSHCESNEVFQLLGESCDECRPGGAQVVDDKTGVMFFGELSINAIRCWNGDQKNFGPLTQDNVLVSPELDYVSDLAITKDRELVVASCDLRTFMNTEKKIIIRVFVGAIDCLLENTVCQNHANISEHSCCYKDP